MPYIYATALPGDIVKLGYGSDRSRARAAQTYYVAPVEVLALLPTEHPRRDERAAQRVCKEWHVRGELYHVPVEWLVDAHPIIARISEVLGVHIKPASETRNQKLRRQRIARLKLKAARPSKPRRVIAPPAPRRVRQVERPVEQCIHGHWSVRRSGNCTECVRLSNERFKARRQAKKT